MDRLSPRTRLRDAAGFTLMELLVAMSISVTIMGTALLLTGQVQKSYTSQLDGAAVQQEARYALDWISRALISAGSNPASITVSGCPAVGTTFRAIQRDPNANGVQDDIRIHADINPQNGLIGGLAGTCVETGEDITIGYDAANRTITRRDNGVSAAQVSMSDTVISQLRFEYLDANRVATANDLAVSTVRVTVTAQTPTIDQYTGQPLSFTLSSDVRLRAR